MIPRRYLGIFIIVGLVSGCNNTSLQPTSSGHSPAPASQVSPSIAPSPPLGAEPCDPSLLADSPTSTPGIRADEAALLPAGATAVDVVRATLGGRTVVAVASDGPSNCDQGYADVQILAVDQTGQLHVAWDGSRLINGDTLNRLGELGLFSGVAIYRLGMARMRGPDHLEIYFAAYSHAIGGSGHGSAVVVVDFDGISATVVYTNTDSPGDVKSSGNDGVQQLELTGALKSASDPNCCWTRDYRARVAYRAGQFVETADDRPWLGTYTGFGSSGPDPVLATAAHSPASGLLLPGDEIVDVRGWHVWPLDINHFHVTAPDSVDQKLNLTAPGDRITVEVRRSGRTIVVSVTVGSLADASYPVAALLAQSFRPGHFLGICTLENFGDERCKRDGGGETPGGLVVAVIPGSPAEIGGVEKSDVVNAIDGISITTTSDFYSQLASRHPGESIHLSLTRDGQRLERTLLVGAPSELEPTRRVAFM